MEKLIYPVWKSPSQSLAEFKAALLGPMSDALLASGAKKLRISIDDEAVSPAAQLRQENIEQMMHGVISIWVDSYIYREKQQAILGEYVDSYHGYLVTESEAIVNTQHPAVEGERTEGMNEIVFLRKPERLARHEWIDTWHNSHTQVAIDTQSTFGYRQNVVAMVLTDGAPPFDAIVEENFPAAAMNSPHAFYDAVDENGQPDNAKLNERVNIMVESCARFIDFEQLVVLPTSEYSLKL